MGLLDDYADLKDEVTANTFDIPDGVYNYVVDEFYVKHGSKANPDMEFIVIQYQIENTDTEKNYKFSEFFPLPENPDDKTENDMKSLSRLKTRLLSLGVEDDAVNEVDDDNLPGATGKFQLSSTPSKKGDGRVFQNVRNVRPEEAPNVDTASEPAKKPAKKKEPEPEPEAVEDSTETDDEIKARIKAKRSQRKAEEAGGGKPNPFTKTA